MKRGGPKVNAERIAAARRALARFQTEADAERTLVQVFACSRRAARRAIETAKLELETNLDRDSQRTRIRQGLEYVVAEAIAAKHLRVAILAYHELIALDGLAAPTQVNVEHGGLDPHGLMTSQAAIKARLDELRAKALAEQVVKQLEAGKPDEGDGGEGAS